MKSKIKIIYRKHSPIYSESSFPDDGIQIDNWKDVEFRENENDIRIIGDKTVCIYSKRDVIRVEIID